MTIGRGYAPTLPASALWSSERVFGVAKTRCKDPVSSDAVRLVGTAMKDKWGDSREGTSLSVTSEVHEGNRVPLSSFGGHGIFGMAVPHPYF